MQFQVGQRAPRGGSLAIVATTLASVVLVSGPACAASTAAAVAAPGPGSGTVFLINGDRLTTSGPGGRSASVLQVAPGAGAVITLGLGSQRYDIPADTLPFVGHGLSPSLFSPATLRQSEAAGRLPVRISYAGGRPVLPGITITRTGAGTASGYLTATSARTFGAALARQFRADHAGASYGRDGMFASGTTITTPGAGPWSARTRPDFPMHTLTVRGANLKGRPDTGDTVWVFNAADWRTFGDPVESASEFYHGTARFSVPAGPYWAIGFFGTGTSPRLVVLPQFTVAGQHTTVRLAASSAVRVTMSTPRPSIPWYAGVLIVRGGQAGTSESVGDASLSVWINPTHSRPTVGTLSSYTSGQQVSPPGMRGTPYEYLLAPASPQGLIPDQHWIIRPGSLATVADRFYQARPGSGTLFTYGGNLAQLRSNQLGGRLVKVRLPGPLTQYVTGGPSALWDDWYGYPTIPMLASYGQSGLLAPRPGARLADSWGQYPLHPAPDVQPLTGSGARVVPQAPSAYRMGNTLVLQVTPFSDNSPGHRGPVGVVEHGVTGRYAVYQNGTEIAHGNPFTPAGSDSRGGLASGVGTPVRLPARPSAIRLVLTATQKVVPPLSTSTTTVWTWRSRRDPRARVPAGWFCQATEHGPLVRTCAVQPMLAVDYHVHGMTLDGRTPPGRQVITLDVGRIELGGQARITSVTVRESANGGRTWRRAAVRSAAPGRFTVTFTGHARTEITLRVAARDGADGSVTETIRDAYGVRS